MVEAIRILRREHGNAAKLLAALERQLEIFREGGTPDYDIVRAAMEYFRGFPSTCHHPKEDLVFARLKEKSPEAAAAIGDLGEEHIRLADLSQRSAEAIEALLGDAEMPRDTFESAVGDFIAAQRRHMAMEEETFFPKALEALSVEDWAEVDARLVDRNDPLFGEEVAERFQRLREDILRWEREAL